MRYNTNSTNQERIWEMETRKRLHCYQLSWFYYKRKPEIIIWKYPVLIWANLIRSKAITPCLTNLTVKNSKHNSLCGQPQQSRCDWQCDCLFCRHAGQQQRKQCSDRDPLLHDKMLRHCLARVDSFQKISMHRQSEEVDKHKNRSKSSPQEYWFGIN